jgi:hypothetical protein
MRAAGSVATSTVDHLAVPISSGICRPAARNRCLWRTGVRVMLPQNGLKRRQTERFWRGGASKALDRRLIALARRAANPPQIVTTGPRPALGAVLPFRLPEQLLGLIAHADE